MAINPFIKVHHWSVQEGMLYPNFRAVAGTRKCVLIDKVMEELFPWVCAVCHGTRMG